MTHIVLRLVAVATCLVLGGCAAPYLDRSEGVAFGAGDAVAANAAQHMIDPWPRASYQTNLTMDGERANRAIERYRTNRVPLSNGGSFKSEDHSGGSVGATPVGASGTP